MQVNYLIFYIELLVCLLSIRVGKYTPVHVANIFDSYFTIDYKAYCFNIK